MNIFKYHKGSMNKSFNEVFQKQDRKVEIKLSMKTQTERKLETKKLGSHTKTAEVILTA